MDSKVLCQRTYAQNVTLYFPYRQYTNLSLYFYLYMNTAYTVHYFALYIYTIWIYVVCFKTYFAKTYFGSIEDEIHPQKSSFRLTYVKVWHYSFRVTLIVTSQTYIPNLSKMADYGGQQESSFKISDALSQRSSLFWLPS